ncbi:succinate dehydrogenase, cytochrome b556 subunit [Leptospira interrogans]
MAEANARERSPVQRPLSPHLQIYSPLINMMMSITHRITGVALYFGTLLLAWWLLAAATSADHFAFVTWVLTSWFGQLVLFGFTWAMVVHLLGGIRHLIWDTGRGFDLPTVDLLSWGTLIGSVIITVALWAAVIAMRGGF